MAREFSALLKGQVVWVPTVALSSNAAMRPKLARDYTECEVMEYSGEGHPTVKLERVDDDYAEPVWVFKRLIELARPAKA